MPELCLRMAQSFRGATLLPNTRGSAPGLLVEEGDKVLVLFPGVPWEMEEMLERDLLPLVRERAGGRVRNSRTLLLGGVIESETEARIESLHDRFGRENITILASYGVLRLVLSAEGADLAAGERQLDEMEQAFREVLAADVAATEVDGLAEVVLAAARGAGVSLATAESCTGGLVGSWLTAVPGSSDVYRGGVISYSNEAKERMLDVPTELLVEHGAVSEAVARAMAQGARARLNADWGVALTGVAGPGGGSVEKPVGLVHWAVAGPRGCWAEHRVFSGNRQIVRQWSANSALDLLRRRIAMSTSMSQGSGNEGG
jgi:nicotinamide-nucleotide amidase